MSRTGKDANKALFSTAVVERAELGAKAAAEADALVARFCKGPSPAREPADPDGDEAKGQKTGTAKKTAGSRGKKTASKRGCAAGADPDPSQSPSQSTSSSSSSSASSSAPSSSSSSPSDGCAGSSETDEARQGGAAPRHQMEEKEVPDPSEASRAKAPESPAIASSDSPAASAPGASESAASEEPSAKPASEKPAKKPKKRSHGAGRQSAKKAASKPRDRSNQLNFYAEADIKEATRHYAYKSGVSISKVCNDALRALLPEEELERAAYLREKA